MEFARKKKGSIWMDKSLSLELYVTCSHETKE